MKHIVVPVKNIARLAEASDALLTRTIGTPGMGLIFGKSGLGKTTATAWFVNQCNGIYVRALATWTPTAMLQTILVELDMATTGRCSALVSRVVDALRNTGRPLFLDEFDYIVENKRMTETLRDIHDLSSVPIILIGMEGIQRKVQLREQFVNRVAQWVEFKPTDFEDCRYLSDSMCEIGIKDELLKKLYQASNGVIRLLVIGLDAIERKARTVGVSMIGSEEWGTSAFFLSDSPKTKRRGSS